VAFFRVYNVIYFVVYLGFSLFNLVLPDFSDIYVDVKKNKMNCCYQRQGR
jgi:hypothetical protein